jgi:hypothetical protein
LYIDRDPTIFQDIARHLQGRIQITQIGYLTNFSKATIFSLQTVPTTSGFLQMLSSTVVGQQLPHLEYPPNRPNSTKTNLPTLRVGNLHPNRRPSLPSPQRHLLLPGRLSQLLHPRLRGLLFLPPRSLPRSRPYGPSSPSLHRATIRPLQICRRLRSAIESAPWLSTACTE